MASDRVRYVRLSAVARHFGVTAWTVRNWVNTGKLVACRPRLLHYTDTRPRVKKGGNYYVREDDLLDFMTRWRGVRQRMLPADLERAARR